MQNMRARILLAVLITIASVWLTGCPPRLRISDINRDPGRYAGKEVTVAGRVSTSLGVFGTGFFQIDDGTGTIWVYSQNFGVPGNGAKVAVTGRIEQGVNVGGRSFATLLRETQRRH